MGGMSRDFAKPVRMSTARLEASLSDDPADVVIDPAERATIAHETARILLDRGKKARDQEVVTRLVRFADEHGLDTLADLWSQSGAHSLPGALWRLYLVRAVLRHNLEDARLVFQQGVDSLPTIDQVVAGAPDPLDAEGLSVVLDEIVGGIYTGELSEALDRAAAIARAVSAGAIALSWTSEDQASYLTSRSLNWSVIADELAYTARLARRGELN